MENMNAQVTGTETASVTYKLLTSRSPGPDVFIGEFYQILREELTAILLKLFQKKKKTKPNHRGRNTSELIVLGHHRPDTNIR